MTNSFFVVGFIILITSLLSNINKGTDSIVNHESIHEIAYDATVSKTSVGAHRTIMAAIAAAPTLGTSKYYIHIESGLYNERVEVWDNRTNLVFVGDGASSTKISWNRHVPDYSTTDSATITVKGQGFLAMYISFENRAGDGSQAVAMLNYGYHSAFYRCSFMGYQDTLYVRRASQFYKECDIYGTVDFVFGDAPAVFQSCNLYARLPKTITFTAQSKKEMEDPSGFVMQNCTFSVAPGLENKKPLFNAYLGRPWSNLSTVIIMESYLDNIIQPSGWMYWENRTTDVLFYREFQNSGPGASTRKRVNWKGYKVVKQREELRKFTVAKFISGDEWLPETLIPFKSGFMNE